MAEDKKKPKPGPKEDRLILEGDWKERVKQALEKKRPEGGWPKPDPKKQKAVKGKRQN